MKTKEELLARIKVLAGTQDLNEDEREELETLNSQLSAMKSKEDAAKLLAQAAADEKAEQEAKIEAAVKAARLEEREKAEAAKRRLPGGEIPYQAQYADTWKFDNLDAADLSLAMEMGKSLNVPLSPAAFKAMSLRIAELKDDNTEKGRKDVAYVKGSFKSATGIDPEKAAVEAAIKAATDPMYTGGSTIGSDWVGTAYSNAIWNVIRAENRVAGNVPADVIPDGYSSKIWPLESTDMTWYKVAEATASDATLKVPAATVTASQIATGSKTISVAKIGSRGLYTGELTEDSLISFAPQLRAQLEASGAEIVEHLFIDGDVETSNAKNINAIDTTPAATDVFLSFDGFRKLALVTNTANSRSAGGSLTIEDFLATMQLMGTAGLAGTDPSKVAFIVDGNTYYAMARLPEVKTKDINTAATVENGFVSKVWGVGVLPSWQMHRTSAKRMANNAGKVDADTDANNTLGAIVCVRWDQWKQAYKRRMTMETTRIANADSWEIVALARLGLAYRDNEASAVTYNVGV
jgi:hypothetical protein